MNKSENDKTQCGGASYKYKFSWKEREWAQLGQRYFQFCRTDVNLEGCVCSAFPTNESAYSEVKT